MRYIVTGGAGFIGSNLVDELLKLEHEVIVIDDFSLGKRENLFQHKNNKNLIIFRKSICSDLGKIFEMGIDAVFHLAAIPMVQFSIKKPLQTHEVNVNGTLNLLNFCKKFNVKRFIFSSSCSVYGDQKIPFVENMRTNPLSPYALHKVICENYCKLFNFLYGLECISLRYFNVFGPRQNPKGEYACLIPKFIKLINNNKRPIIFGKGNHTRDFVYVSDVVRANILAVNTKNKKCFGQSINIGSGKNLSVNEVTEKILKLCNKDIRPIHGQEVIEPEHALADIEKAKKLLGWEPKVSFEEGLEKTYKFFSYQ